MNIIPKLSLNKHPKDSDNLSFVNALNVKLSNDGSCITNEESVKLNDYIYNYLNSWFGVTSTNGRTFEILGVIPCNEELVIIAKSSLQNFANIFRYKETSNNVGECRIVYYNLGYHGGKIKGTFTYNVEGSLIVAIAEYDCDELVPLRTINLGNFEDNNIANDRNLSDSKLSIAPEVHIPSVSYIDHIPGAAYKGWHYLFIRFKINSTDYTQWFSIGYPIYIDTLKQYQIIKYIYNRKYDKDVVMTNGGYIAHPNDQTDGYAVGCADYCSTTLEVAEETFSAYLTFNADDDYDKYQIGIIVSSKSYTKAFRTSDITKTSTVQNYIFDIKSVIEASANEFIIDNYNYYNVGNIINYKNRLYISNYNEFNLNNKSIVDSGILDKITVTLSTTKADETESIVYDFALLSENKSPIPDQYESNYDGRLPLYIYLNISPDTYITVNYNTVRADQAYIYSRNVDNYGFAAIYVNGVGTLTGTVTIGLPSNNNVNGNYVTINCDKSVPVIGRPFINAKNKFDLRKESGTLIPGEVYNFFIHYVDKYGHATNGYRIDNNIKYRVSGSTEEVCVIPFLSGAVNMYAAMPMDSNVVTKGILSNSLNTTGIEFYMTCTKSGNDVILSNKITDSYALSNFKESFNSFVTNTKDSNLKWYQVACPYNLPTFSVYINNNGDRLFRVPIPVKSGSLNNIFYRANFYNIRIPDEYVGFFISYEKFEPINRVSGFLTRSDFRSQDYIVDQERKSANSNKSSKMYFYSSEFDIADSIKMDYNIMRIDGVNVWNKEDIIERSYYQRSRFYDYVHDMNKAQTSNDFTQTPAVYAVPKYKLAVGDSAADSRIGVGTALELEDTYGLFHNAFSGNGLIRQYKVTFLNCSRNIYTSKNKTLIRLSDIIYKNDITVDSQGNYFVSPFYGYNGHYTWDGVLVYESSGCNFNVADNKMRRMADNTEFYPNNTVYVTDFKESVKKAHSYELDTPFASYVQTLTCDTKFHESKCFKNAPVGVVYFTHYDKETPENNKFAIGCMVIPLNSIDLFENRQGSSDDFHPKTYTNYRDDIVSIERFDKTIRRSNVIQDESRVNGWRTFPVEAYKNIAENKGNITNLVGIGTMLLVHTQHSLFAFDISNALTTEEQNIQLTQPDVFEVKYKEVFTSDLGYGGLQDDKSFVVDQFGYIFYDNDSNRFYRFDSGNLITIDNDIIEWLRIHTPYNIRFANDRRNNRLLISLTYDINVINKVITLSYNYKSNSFISFHDYSFKEAFNTKNNLYMLCDKNDHVSCAFHQFVKANTEYGSFDNLNNYMASGSPMTRPSIISIIVNDAYSLIKYLEYITYKLNKININSDVDTTSLPVETKITPYAGDYLRVYNELIDTGVLDITVTDSTKNNFCEFTKPYWHLGNWNYSYLRNNVANRDNYGDAYNMSRLFGNYFIIEFRFTNYDKLKFEFEDLTYNITK